MPNKISFVVASVDRDEQLQQCISSIEKAHEFAKDIPIEILVVIQKAKKKKELLINYPEIVAVFYIDKLGLSLARNYAIEKSKGDYLVFLDDDAEVKEDFIEELSKSTRKYSSVNAFCGRLLGLDGQTPFSVLFRNTKAKKLRRLDFQYFMGSAHVLSRRVINKIGAYNERFGVGSNCYGGGEETEYFVRLKAAKEQVFYLPNLIFYHPIIYPSFKYANNYGHAYAAMMMQNCVNDKFYFFIYLYIVFRLIVKLSVRSMQNYFLSGKYHSLEERYQYNAWLRGLFKGIKDFVKNEFWPVH